MDAKQLAQIEAAEIAIQAGLEGVSITVGGNKGNLIDAFKYLRKVYGVDDDAMAQKGGFAGNVINTLSHFQDITFKTQEARDNEKAATLQNIAIQNKEELENLLLKRELSSLTATETKRLEVLKTAVKASTVTTA